MSADPPSPPGADTVMRDASLAESQLDQLNQLNVTLAANLDLEVLTQSIIETATRLTGAAYGAFFEREAAGEPDLWRLASLAGAPREAFTRFGLPRPTTLFGPTFRAEAVIRSSDVLTDPRYGSMGGMPKGHLSVRSYMACAVVSRSSGIIGALLFGHPEPHRFGDREERFIVGFAAQTAVAIENARLFGSLEAEVRERRLVEAGLRRSDQRFRAAIAAIRGVLWTNSADGRMSGEQPGWAALTGQTFEAYQDFGWAKAIHPDDAGPTVAAWNAAVAARETFVFEHRVRRGDGLYRNFAVRAVPISDDGEAGGIREWVGVHTDITEQRQAEARLEAARQAAEAANRAKSQFIANMSHELRTPLSAVIGYSGMVAEEIEDLGHSGLVDDVRKIEANARHLLGLINDVLDLSKIEAGRMTVSIGTFAVLPMIEDVLAAAAPLVARRGNTMKLDLAPDLGSMRSDEVKIRQCLLNLIGNAAKFTDRGEIALSVARVSDGDEDWLSFGVSDTGIGLTPEQLKRLFQRFVQADDSTTRQFGGTGLGLSITRAFCRKLGGDVTVDSRYGIGSTFTISLPATAEGDRLNGELWAEPPTRRGGIVLVVDDDSAARELLTRFLERDGYEVKTARDGGQGLALARRYRPHVMLLDVEMPYVDGWEVLRAVRDDAVLRDTPVIMISVLDERSVGIVMGADDYLVKPIDRGELKRALDRFRESRATGRVLVVDDDPDARSWMAAALSRDGWTIDLAANGKEALDRLDAAIPDLVVLDLVMPVMDGFAFLRSLRSRPDTAGVHVVVLSAKDMSNQDRAALGHDVDRVMQKGSVRLDELREELRRLVPDGATNVGSS